ncbi:TetR/AcrR family transcriptional regulator [Flindersiella endophytica]
MAEPERKPRGRPRGRARGASGHTREQICAIATELFNEQGYDKTSLREIADRLGVTKAALYYHFKSKEEIVWTIVDDYLAEVDDVIASAGQQPATPEARRETLERYAEVVGQQIGSMRFFQQNPSGLKSTELGQKFRTRMGELHKALLPQDPSDRDRLHAFLAVITQHIASEVLKDSDADKATRAKTALEVGLELLP